MYILLRKVSEVACVEGVGFIPPIFEAPQDLQNHQNPLEVSSN